MKTYLTILLTLLTINVWSQQDTAANSAQVRHLTYERHAVIATAAFGFVDLHRTEFQVPPAFQKNNVSGYDLLYAKLEYGFTDRISIAATFGYDAFVYNFSQVYTGYNGPIERYKMDQYRLVSGGLTAFYHLGHIIKVRHLDPFIGVGTTINNIRHSALPQGDSTVVTIEHTVTPSIKVGARYYITSKVSLYGEAGYDQQSIFALGASCRFFSRKNH